MSLRIFKYKREISVRKRKEKRNKKLNLILNLNLLREYWTLDVIFENDDLDFHVEFSVKFGVDTERFPDYPDVMNYFILKLNEEIFLMVL